MSQLSDKNIFELNWEIEISRSAYLKVPSEVAEACSAKLPSPAFELIRTTPACILSEVQLV
ncbi:MAG: hypothetical protein WDW20_05335 [Neisseriaceae bacterium]